MSRIRAPALAATLALAVAGCASVSPQSAAPSAVDVPAAWSASSGPASARATSLAQWWSRFDDPLLGTLVARALEANTSVQGAQAALRQARALRDVTAATLLPAVGASASAQRSTAGSDTSSNSYKAGLDASWEPDVFGGNRSALGASEANVQGQRREPGRRAGLPRRRGRARLHRAARRPGAARDRQRQPRGPAGDPPDHAVAASSGPRHVARSRAGAVGDRADPRPAAGVADLGRAGPPRAGGADRPASGGFGDRAGRSPAGSAAARRPGARLPGRDAAPAARRARRGTPGGGGGGPRGPGRGRAPAVFQTQRLAGIGRAHPGVADQRLVGGQRAARRRDDADLRRRRRSRAGTRPGGRAGAGAGSLRSHRAHGAEGRGGRPGRAARGPRTPAALAKRRRSRRQRRACSRATGSAAAWWTSRSCSTPSARSSTRRTAWRAPAPT